MTIQSLILQAATELSKSSETAFLDVEILLAHLLKKPREYLLTHPKVSLNKKQVATYQKLIHRRKKGEPVAYLIGYKYFYGLKFKVDFNTLIPRPETELMVEKALWKITNLRGENPNLSVIDLGTGSGAIIISLANQLKNKSTINFTATDISKNALKVARENAKNNKISSQISFLQSDLLSHKKISALFKQKSPVVILANLPYLSKEVYSSAPITVKNFEPLTALFSGQDGLSHYRKLLKQIKNFTLGSNQLITLFCEISPEQKTLIKKEIENYFSTAKIKFHKDLAKRWRLVEVEI
ncbi:MAG TPA: peptide chain release factor N(5)-glutamine methyltransferase [Candidatus Moranbacteria bacterium]|nr:peptide chain release factor N(5)-glutamine methyltransferase [Candidatus Moranbacteria bacterium]